jgi:hypothetical protein
MGFTLLIRRYHYASTHQAYPGEALRVLREAFGEKEIQWCFGKLGTFFEAEDLRCPVHGEVDDQGEGKPCSPTEEGGKTQGANLREMRNGTGSSHSSQGQQSIKQCSCEFDDIVRELSSEMALGEWARNSEKAHHILYDMWKESGGARFLHEPLSALHEIWQSITYKEVGAFRRHFNLRDKDRTARLKALGNAIVWQVAARIMMAIRQVDVDCNYNNRT